MGIFLFTCDLSLLGGIMKPLHLLSLSFLFCFCFCFFIFSDTRSIDNHCQPLLPYCYDRAFDESASMCRAYVRLKSHQGGMNLSS